MLTEELPKNLNDLFILAVANDDVEQIKSLLNQGADLNHIDAHGNTALHIAIVSKKFQVAEYLCKRGIDKEVQNEKGHTALSILVKLSATSNIIHFLSAHGHVELLKSLHQKGVNLNQLDKEGYTPLIVASLYDQGEVVRELHKMGIDINQVDKTTEQLTALMWAARCEKIEALSTLSHIFHEIFFRQGSMPCISMHCT